MTVNLVACSNCGTQAYAGATFCHHCGNALPTGTQSSAARTPWTPTDIAKALIIPVLVFGGSAIAAILIGEQKQEYTTGELITTYSIGIVVEVVLVAFVWWFTVRKYRAPLKSLGFSFPQRGGPWLPLGLVFVAFSIFFAYLAVLLAIGVELEGDVPKGTFDSVPPIIMLGILSVFFAPVAEETFFRGFVFGGLRSRWSLLTAALASGLLFGLAHAGNPDGLLVIPPITAIGVLFAWGYAHTGSLLTPMLAHALFNGLVLGAGIAGV